MLLFHVICEHRNHKFIFARSFDHAAEQFGTWQMANEAPMGSFSVERVKFLSKIDPQAVHLREALELGIEGFGKYSREHGWTIRPVSDERPIPD